METSEKFYEGLDLQYISGTWRPGGSSHRIVDRDPYSGEDLATIQGASREDVDDALAAAQLAQKEWEAVLPYERAEVLTRASQIFSRRHDEIANWLTKEAGATTYWARQIIAHAQLVCSESAAYAQTPSGEILPSLVKGQESRVYRKPVGVVSVISPWNSPVNLTTRAVAPALAMGNAVIVKPASDTPISGGSIVGKVFEEAGLPPGLLSIVSGSANEIGNMISEHDAISVVSFTGSTPVGRGLLERNAQARYLKRVGLELGGNAPCIVLDDADLDDAASGIIFGRFLHQGQICMSTNRVLVHTSIHDELVDRLKQRIECLPYGNPFDPTVVVGPLINQRATQSVLQKIEAAVADGAEKLVGEPTEGNVVPPHLFVDVPLNGSLGSEEIFGPVLPVMKFENLEQALDSTNRSEYGISAAVWSKDIARAEKFAHGIRSGFVCINDQTVATDIYGPFGGEKNSGIGHFNGKWIIEEYTRPHLMLLQRAPRAYPF